MNSTRKKISFELHDMSAQKSRPFILVKLIYFAHEKDEMKICFRRSMRQVPPCQMASQTRFVCEPNCWQGETRRDLVASV